MSINCFKGTSTHARYFLLSLNKTLLRKYFSRKKHKKLAFDCTATTGTSGEIFLVVKTLTYMDNIYLAIYLSHVKMITTNSGVFQNTCR